MKKLLYIIGLVFIVGFINAQQDIYRFNIGISASDNIDNNKSEGNSINPGLHLNYNFNKSFSLGTYFINEGFTKSSNLFLDFTYHTDNDYLFFSRAKIAPYLGAGIGTSALDQDYLYRFKFGLKFRIYDRFNLYSQLNHQRSANFNYRSTRLQIGISYSFGYYNNDYSAAKILTDDINNPDSFKGYNAFVNPNKNFQLSDSLLVLDSIYLNDTLEYKKNLYNSGIITYTDTIINRNYIVNTDSISYSDFKINKGLKYYTDTIFISEKDSTQSKTITDTVIYNDSISFSDTVFYSENIAYADTLNYTDTIIYTDSVQYFDTIPYSSNIIYTDTLLYVKSALPYSQMRKKGILIPLKKLKQRDLKYIYHSDSSQITNKNIISDVEYSTAQSKRKGEVKVYKEDGEIKIEIAAGSDLDISLDENILETKPQTIYKTELSDTNKRNLNFGSNENANYLESKINRLEEKLENQKSENESSEIADLKREIAGLQKQINNITAKKPDSEINSENNDDGFNTVFDSKDQKTGLLDDIVEGKRKSKINDVNTKKYLINDTSDTNINTDSIENAQIDTTTENTSGKPDLITENDSLKQEIRNMELRLAALENYIYNKTEISSLNDKSTKKETKTDTIIQIVRDTLVKTNEKVITKERDISVKKDLRFVKFYYETNVYKLTAEQKSRLNRLISSYKTNENFKILISGYTDGKGSAEYNKILSNKRINAIVDYMTENGVDVNRIYRISYGQSKSEGGENSEERRVEVRLFDFY